MRSTLGGQTDSDVARLEQIRVDDFHELMERLEQNEKAQKAREKGKRRGGGRGKEKGGFDSEDSEEMDSEESGSGEEDGEGSSESESSEEEVVVRKKKGKKGRSKD